MKAIIDSVRAACAESRNAIVYSAALSVVLQAYFIFWHITAVVLGSGFSLLDVAAPFAALAAGYSAASLLLACVITALFIVIRGPLARRIVLVSVMALFFASEIVRMFDWGALYFGGNHIDNNFWAHAFYADGTVYLWSKQAFAIYLAVALFFTALLFVLRRLSSATDGEGRVMNLRDALRALMVNCAALLLLYGLSAGTIALGGAVRAQCAAERPDDHRLSGEDANIMFDKELLKDRKRYEQSLDRLKAKYRRVKTSDAGLYLKVPESEFTKSVIYYFVLARSLGSREVILSDATVNNFRKMGLVLYTMGREYPLMKRSIYVDGRGAGHARPFIRPGTNVIVIFVESLSQFFLREDVHGVRGLTPTIHDMERNSLRFGNMLNASYPTLKGLIAALGSTLYLLDESVGGTRVSVPCRFLFLSNILKALNYTTVHIQAGSERFIGMKELFTKRQGYDYFYGSESLAIDNIATMKGGFGVDDETMFRFAIDWLGKYSGPKPFLLTMSTINTHPPFKVRYRAPQAGGNDLLDSLYSTDRALGEFWEFFRKSKYSGNTVVILTADHAMGNCRDYNEFAGRFGDHYRPFFDSIPLLIYFPDTAAWRGKTIDTACLSLDILPSILDMMGLDLPNPFMGLSVFSERKKYGPIKLEDMKIGGGARTGVTAKEPSEGKIETGAPDGTTLDEARNVIGFFFNLYTTDRILPPDYRVKFN